MRGDQQVARKCYVQSVRTLETYKRAGDGRQEKDVEVERKRRKEGKSSVAEYEPGELLAIMIDLENPEKQARVGQQMAQETRDAVENVLKDNCDMFA